MKLILPYFILFIVVIQLLLKKNSKKGDNANTRFWERESQANSTRKKDISTLNYIVIPDTLPLDALASYSEEHMKPDANTKIHTALNTINVLKDRKILDLSSFSNTDLKLEYGVANFTQLSEFDNNYTQLIRALNAVGTTILSEQDNDDAAALLEYAIGIGSDLSTTYTALAQHYKKNRDTASIARLIKNVESMDSLMKHTLLKELNALSAD